MVPALQEAVTPIVYTRPGCGGSDALPAALAATPWSTGQAAEQLRELLSRLDVPAPRVFAGHSIGGLIIEAYASRWPGEVAGMVLVDPSSTELALGLDKPDRVFADSDDGTGIVFSWDAIAAEQRAFGRRCPLSSSAGR